LPSYSVRESSKYACFCPGYTGFGSRFLVAVAMTVAMVGELVVAVPRLGHNSARRLAQFLRSIVLGTFSVVTGSRIGQYPLLCIVAGFVQTIGRGYEHDS
jgi:hypothetical protein